MSLEMIKEEEISSSDSEEKLMCRFCLDDEYQEDLFVPCHCSGTARFVHRRCLQEWRSQDIHSLNYTRCQECLYEYEMSNEISNVLSCWINLCKLLSSSYFFMFLLIVAEYLGWMCFFIHVDPKGYFGQEINMPIDNEYAILSIMITILPKMIIIAIHDLYIYFHYRLNTYFDRYAGGLGVKNTFLFFCICIFFISMIFPLLGLIFISMLFQRIFKHMLEKHYYRHITERSTIRDQRNDLEIVVVR
jgi:hypothetical protein